MILFIYWAIDKDFCSFSPQQRLSSLQRMSALTGTVINIGQYKLWNKTKWTDESMNKQKYQVYLVGTCVNPKVNAGRWMVNGLLTPPSAFHIHMHIQKLTAYTCSSWAIQRFLTKALLEISTLSYLYADKTATGINLGFSIVPEDNCSPGLGIKLPAPWLVEDPLDLLSSSRP